MSRVQIPSPTPPAQKTAVLVLLIPLILTEFFPCAALLPRKWERAIENKIPGILSKSHDWTPITHPNLDQEIELVLHEHFGLRFVTYAVIVVLLAGNTWVIHRLWRFAML
jgi:hypothetical protein